MKKKITIYLIAIVTIINISSLATIIYLKLQQEKMGNMTGLPPTKEMRTKRFQQMKEKLNLTPLQVEEFEILRDEFHSRLDSLDGEAQKLRQDMIEEIWKNDYDNEEIENLLTRFGGIQNETQRWVVRNLHKFKKLLTPEQAEIFYSIVSERFAGLRKNPGLGRMPMNQEEYK